MKPTPANGYSIAEDNGTQDAYHMIPFSKDRMDTLPKIILKQISARNPLSVEAF